MKISLNPFAVVFISFSKAAWDLQTAVLKCMGEKDGFSKASWGTNTDFQEALEKLLVVPCGFITAVTHYSKRV